MVAVTELRLGYEAGTGDAVDIPISHTLMTGITRHGKSETMKAVAERAADAGYSVLLFDVKAERDYADIGTEIPVYLEESTDPMTLKGLLETDSDISLSFEFSEIIDVCARGDDYESILDVVNSRIGDDDTHPMDEKKYRVIGYLLERIIDDMANVDISDDLELADGVSVMDLHDVDDSVKQIAIAASVKRVLESRDNVVLGIDEAHNFIPQHGKPPANEPITNAIREGGAKDVWVWLSDQTITGVDKDPLKQVGVWVLGKQREKNEAQRVLDQIPGGSQHTSDDVMTLPEGHFITALDDASPLTYVQPTWLDEETAREIATGERSMDDITKPDGDELTDEEREQLDAELGAMVEEREREVRELQEALEDREATIQRLEQHIEELEADPEDASNDTELAGDDPRPPAAGDVDEDRVRGIIDEYIETAEVPGEVSVEATQSKLVIRRKVEPVEVTVDGDLLGKVAYLYAREELPADSWFTTGDVEDIFESHGWAETVKRTSVLNDMAQMGFVEMRVRSDRTREYRIKMPPDVAESKGLLSFEEVVADG